MLWEGEIEAGARGRNEWVMFEYAGVFNANLVECYAGWMRIWVGWKRSWEGAKLALYKMRVRS